MANTCSPWVQACAMRVSRLASDGSPIAGSDDLYVTDQFTTFRIRTVKKTGDEFTVPNACGEDCVNYKAPDTYKRLDIDLGLCVRDPELMELISGGTRLSSGAAVGYAYPALGSAGNDGVALEFWAKRLSGTTGQQDATFPYERILFPRAYLFHADWEIANAPIVAAFSGFAIENPEFLDGPQNDWTVASSRVVQSLPVATIPTPACGYQTALAS